MTDPRPHLRRASRPGTRGALLVGALALALSACTSPYPGGARDGEPSEDPTPTAEATPSPSPTATEAVGLGTATRGLPPGVDEAGAGESVVGVGWSSDGSELYVTTLGSSSCPSVPTAIAFGTGTAAIEMTTTGGAVCTMDFVPTTSALPAPAGAVPTASAAVEVAWATGGVSTGTLEAAADPIAFSWLETTLP